MLATVDCQFNSLRGKKVYFLLFRDSIMRLDFGVIEGVGMVLLDRLMYRIFVVFPRFVQCKINSWRRSSDAYPRFTPVLFVSTGPARVSRSSDAVALE